MGQYRFSCYLNKQFGFLIKYDEFEIKIDLLFVSIYIALTKEAEGYNIFDKWKN